MAHRNFLRKQASPQKRMTMARRRIAVDFLAKEIWFQITNQEGEISSFNWITMRYGEEEKLSLSGQGTKGYDEAKLSINEKEITFLLIYGCQKRGKNLLDIIQLFVVWVPPDTDPLKRAQAMLDVDEVVVFFENRYEDFLFVEPSKVEEVMDLKYVTQRVKEIRGVNNPGKYFFDENVLRLRKQHQVHLMEVRQQEEENESIIPVEQRDDGPRKKEVHVLKELITTERYYVKCLNVLYDMFLEPLATHGHKRLHSLIKSLLNPILSVNSELLDDLLRLYGIKKCTYLDEDDQQFVSELKKLDLPFFTREKVSDIIDNVLKHCKTFKFYGPYVSHYSKILSQLTELLGEDEKLKEYYCVVQDDLKSKNHRNTDYTSFLVMPIQRIPRYQLMFKELLKHTLPEDKNFEKIKVSLDEVKGLAKIINENKEGMVKVQKTIILSKYFRKPGLMEQKMVKYKSCFILSKKSQNPGEVFVFDQSLICIQISPKKFKKKKSSNQEQEQQQQQQYSILSLLDDEKEIDFTISIVYEVDLSNPNLRCYKNPKYQEILEIEGENSKIVLKFDNPKLCDEMATVVQHQLAKFHDHRIMTSIFATRVLLKSWLRSKSSALVGVKSSKDPNQSLNNRIFFHVMYADLKVIVFENEDDQKTMIRSFSLLGGAKYGRATAKRAAQASGSGKKKKKGLFSMSRNEDRGPLGDYVMSKAALSEEVEPAWFYISFLTTAGSTSDSGKKKKKKKKKRVTTKKLAPGTKEKVEVKYYFLAKDLKLREVWLKVLEMIDCCERIDETDIQ